MIKRIIRSIARIFANEIVSKMADGANMRRICDAIDFSQERLPQRDPVFLLNCEAAEEAKEFIKDHISRATLYWSMMYPLFWNCCLGKISPELAKGGLNLEFGVLQGESINHFAHNYPELIFHGFDSFEGLPEEWTGMMAPKGTFDLNGAIPEVHKNVILHKGWFDKTLPIFLSSSFALEKKIAFLHIDCDIYSSTKTIFYFAGNRITDGTVIIFDDWFGYPNWQEHGKKVWDEFCASVNIEFHFVAFCGWKAALIVDSITHKGIDAHGD